MPETGLHEFRLISPISDHPPGLPYAPKTPRAAEIVFGRERTASRGLRHRRQIRQQSDLRGSPRAKHLASQKLNSCASSRAPSGPTIMMDTGVNSNERRAVDFILRIAGCRSAAPLPRLISACVNRAVRGICAAVVAVAATATAAATEPRHAIAMHGEPALPPDFTAFRYVNPDAPKGGRLVRGVLGTFDSLNPFIVKGLAPPELRGAVYESLLVRGYDEPFTLYGLLARTVDTDDERSYVTFDLDPRATFADGKPVTAADVIFSWELLRDHGRPNYRTYYTKVARATALGDRTVRFDIAADGDRELPLILGLMPILPRHAIDAAHFEETSLAPPLASGPYKVAAVDPGRSVTLRRNPAYWGKRSRGQPRLLELRRAALRLLSRRQQPSRGLQEGPLRPARRDRPGTLGNRLRFPRRPRRQGDQGSVSERPAEADAGVRVQHPPAGVRRCPGARGDHAVVRLRVAQQELLLRALQPHRELLRRQRTVRARTAGGRGRARAAGAVSRRGAARRSRRHL